MFNSLRLLRHVLTVISMIPTPDSATVALTELDMELMTFGVRYTSNYDKVSMAFLNAEHDALPQAAVPPEYDVATQSPLSSLFSHNVCLRPSGVTVELDPSTQSPLSSLLSSNRCFHPPDPDPESLANAADHGGTSHYDRLSALFLYFEEPLSLETLNTPFSHFHTTTTAVSPTDFVPPVYNSTFNFSYIYLLVLLGSVLALLTVFGSIPSAYALLVSIVIVGLFNVVVVLVNVIPTWQLILGIAWLIGLCSRVNIDDVLHKIECHFLDLAESETAWRLRSALTSIGSFYRQLVLFLTLNDTLVFQADVLRSTLSYLRIPKRDGFRAGPFSSGYTTCKRSNIEGIPVAERSVMPHPVLHSSSSSSLVLALSQASSSSTSSELSSLSPSISTMSLPLAVDSPTRLSSSSSASDISLSSSTCSQDSMTSFDSDDSVLPSTPEFDPLGQDDEPEAIHFLEDDTIESEPAQATAQTMEASPCGMFDILQKGYESRVKRGAQPADLLPNRHSSVPLSETALCYLKLKHSYYAINAMILANVRDGTDDCELRPAEGDVPPPAMSELGEDDSAAAVDPSEGVRRKKRRRPRCQRSRNRETYPDENVAGPSSSSSQRAAAAAAASEEHAESAPRMRIIPMDPLPDVMLLQ